MKVLFVSSGNTIDGISPIISNQGESLRQKGLEVEYYRVLGKGTLAYLKNIPRLRKKIRQMKPDIVHAHYSRTAFVASIACVGTRIPLVVSLMGSDVKAQNSWKTLIQYFSKYSWGKVIVKSQDMKIESQLEDAVVVANGVNINKFKPLDKLKCQEELAWVKEKKHLLFAANPKRPEKNYLLTKNAVERLDRDDLELHYLENVSNEKMVIYYNASDMVILSSLREGSPNVIKEAMACNRPIVSTKVGDVPFLFDTVEGVYLSSFEIEDMAEQIKKALDVETSNGLNRLTSIGLTSGEVATKLISLYKELWKTGKE